MMATVNSLLFALLFIGCWCRFEAEDNPCVPTVRSESFSQFVTNHGCEVDKKLLKLFTNATLFNNFVLNKPYSNFMCIGFMNALTLAPDNVCEFGLLSNIRDGDVCSDKKVMDTFVRIINGSVFNNSTIIYKVADFTKQYCKIVCNGSTNELCWAFGIMAKVALKHHTVPTTAPPTTTPPPTTTAPPSSPPPLPVLGSNKKPDKPTDDFRHSFDGNSVTTEPPKSSDNSDEHGNQGVDDDHHDDDHNDNDDNIGGGIAIDNNSSKTEEDGVNEVQQNKTESNINSVVGEELKNSNMNVSNSSAQDVDANEKKEEEGANDNGLSTIDNKVKEFQNTSQVDNSSVSDFDDDQTIQIDDQADDDDVDLGGDRPTNVDDGSQDDDDDVDLGGDRPTNVDDGSHDDVDQNNDDYDYDDDGYSYWHFAAVLLFILFLGVAVYLASHNRKKIRESVSTYMSKRKRKREYKPVNTMEAGLS